MISKIDHDGKYAHEWDVDSEDSGRLITECGKVVMTLYSKYPMPIDGETHEYVGQLLSARQAMELSHALAEMAAVLWECE